MPCKHFTRLDYQFGRLIKRLCLRRHPFGDFDKLLRIKRDSHFLSPPLHLKGLQFDYISIGFVDLQ